MGGFFWRGRFVIWSHLFWYIFFWMTYTGIKTQNYKYTHQTTPLLVKLCSNLHTNISNVNWLLVQIVALSTMVPTLCRRLYFVSIFNPTTWFVFKACVLHIVNIHRRQSRSAGLTLLTQYHIYFHIFDQVI